MKDDNKKTISPIAVSGGGISITVWPDGKVLLTSKYSDTWSGPVVELEELADNMQALLREAAELRAIFLGEVETA